jgi:hypothetical protein
MICTEQEAKTKWCPHGRIYARYAAFNRLTEEDGNWQEAKCIGSACMSWVWSGYQHSIDGVEGPSRIGTCGLIRSAP